MNLKTAHTLEFNEFKTVINSLKTLDDVEIIFKNLNNENVELFEKLQCERFKIDEYIDKKDALYHKKKIIKTNKKFEIKNNKEINIDVYYNNMENIENIIKLSADEFKKFIEKGNTIEENEMLSSILIKELEKCETAINDLNNKIIDLSSEKDEKRKKWSYLYEYYRSLIKNEDDIKNSPVVNNNEKINKKEDEKKTKNKINKEDNKEKEKNNQENYISEKDIPEKDDNCEKKDNKEKEDKKPKEKKTREKKIKETDPLVSSTEINKNMEEDIKDKKVPKKITKKVSNKTKDIADPKNMEETKDTDVL